jgi:hypothetical protein
MRAPFIRSQPIIISFTAASGEAPESGGTLVME